MWNKKDTVRWPRMSDHAKRNTLKNSFYLQLPTYGLITTKISLLQTIVYEKAFIFFGEITEEKSRKPSRQLKQMVSIANQKIL